MGPLVRRFGPSSGAATPPRSARPHRGGFTIIELMIAVAIVGILATIAIQEFSNITLRSKRAEIAMNLNAIRTAQSAYRAEWEGYLECPLTPASVPGRDAAVFPTNVPDGVIWETLGWVPDGRTYGQYAVIAQNTVGGESHFVAEAFSDIDGDGNLASFRATDIVRPEMLTANNVY